MKWPCDERAPTLMWAVRTPSEDHVQQRLAQSFALDRLWGEMMGTLRGDTKEEPLRMLVTVLEASGTAYAVIGGVAMQVYSQEPRTTLDIDVAVTQFADVPRAALIQAGFDHEGRHAHSDNWRAPGAMPRLQRVAVQFSAEDVGIEQAIAGARVVNAGDFGMRLASPPDLLALKLAAAEEPSRRPSKRRQDLVDILLLTEEYPEAAAGVTGLEERIRRLGASLLTLGRSRKPEER